MLYCFSFSGCCHSEPKVGSESAQRSRNQLGARRSNETHHCRCKDLKSATANRTPAPAGADDAAELLRPAMQPKAAAPPPAAAFCCSAAADNRLLLCRPPTTVLLLTTLAPGLLQCVSSCNAVL